ncbi:DUF5056 domain-containing protein [Prevotella sp. kh1p2]|uniref:DUF5056 domain-containing protein n=1 Tax=Prevotella sp. kh1p2 TaxID=1761883 RepID=UPI0008B779D1|nr:DUF5056 domain-containing protein [Prevotella sp. kh1p2]SES74280.1 protein of unknown function [Prevotella sp. kh1p2]SNU10571.1 protein of unknown function [Prevotellaceae bacterium KH2P17]
MTDNNDEKLIARFFEENRPEIADNGFSRRVMRRLPASKRNLSRLWTALCSLAGLAFFLLFNGFADLRVALGNVFGDFVGALFSAEGASLSPLMFLIALFTLGAVTVFNLANAR